MSRERTPAVQVIAGLLAPWLVAGLAALLGVRVMAALAIALTLLLLLFGLLVLRDRHRLRRLKRGYCDDALRYARKQRSVDRDPDFTTDELIALRRLRCRQDVEGTYRLIAASNQAARARRAAPVVEPVPPMQRKLLYVGVNG